MPDAEKKCNENFTDVESILKENPERIKYIQYLYHISESINSV